MTHSDTQRSETGRSDAGQKAATETSSSAESPAPGTLLVRVAALWLFGALLTVGAAIVTIQLVNTNLYGPEQPVRDYVHALQDGNGGQAMGLLRPQIPAGAAADLLDGAALKAAASSLSDVHVGSPEARDGGRVNVRLSYVLDGKPGVTDFLLEPAGTQWMFFRSWRFVPAPLPVVEVSTVNSGQAQVNGATVGLPNGVTSFAAFYPGRYQAGLDTALFHAEPQTAIVNSPGSKAPLLALSTEASQKLKDQVSSSLKSYLDSCTTQAVLLPTACPIGVTSNNRVVSPIVWKITEYPTPAISAYNGSWVLAPLSFKAEVKYKEQVLATGAFRDVDTTQTYGFTATLAISGDTVTVTPKVQY
ncbi:hypothetical protein [Psychromicrobium xiongbiense]|uniref:hypothetical protein n=1 Tax=Psychromicrobium xiongbiense TaxID=3051184 RepID=UPI002554EE2D|nr:hypothetical protein [Psychromicrobium sp. YIM S02556]